MYLKTYIECRYHDHLMVEFSTAKSIVQLEYPVWIISLSIHMFWDVCICVERNLIIKIKSQQPNNLIVRDANFHVMIP